MGSGSSDAYTGTQGESQPYSKVYRVERKMQKNDKKAGIYHNGHYDKNPTAQNLADLVHGNYIVDKHFGSDNMPYVVDLKGNIIIGKRNGNGREGLATPHPTLIGGKAPKVQMAGLVTIRGGKIIKYDNRSGHYKPNIKSMPVADQAFAKLPKSVFKNYKGGK